MERLPGVYPATWEADVLLRDGHPVHLRPITPDDGDALRAFHNSLSSRTVYFRFFSAKPALTDADVTYFTNVDYVTRVAFIALDAGVMIGVGRFDAIGDGKAEVAFVIRDDVQGLGLGSVLLEHLAAAARELGIRRFVAEVLPENSRMLATFREAGFEITQRREEDVLAVSFDIEPTSTSLAVMQSREHRAESRSVQRLLHPTRVAVVGASRRPGGLGHEVLLHLVNGGFTGDLVAVHPEVDEIAGVPCVRSLTEVETSIDLAVVVVPAEQVPAVIADAEAAGVHGLVVVSGGFGDAGPEGLALQAQLVDTVHRTGMRLVGPNALGLINTDPEVRLNASLVPFMPLAGRIGFFSQSGALASSILTRFNRRGLGLSTFVSAGNRADISGNDLLQYWHEDAGTDCVLLYLETIGNARKFARIVSRLTRRKPVVMVRTLGATQQHPLGHAVGRTELRDRAVEQVLIDCGLIMVDTIHEMLDVAQVAISQPLPTSTRVAIVSNSDALAVMTVNACDGTSLSVVGEPVTFARQESSTAYETAIKAAFADEQVGAVLAIYVPPIEQEGGDEIRDTLRRCASGRDPALPHKTLVSLMLGGDARADHQPNDVPVFGDVEDAVRAVAALAAYAQWVRESVPDDQAFEAIPALTTVMDLAQPGEYRGAEGAGLLADLGIEVGFQWQSRTRGYRVRLTDDPLFGPIVSVGLDDEVAEALDDRSYRLAPASSTTAGEMLRGLVSLPVALAEPTSPAAPNLDEVAALISRVSRVCIDHPTVTTIDLRHVQASSGARATLVATDISVVVSESPIVPEPLARRM